jgi:hypothetical protein
MFKGPRVLTDLLAVVLLPLFLTSPTSLNDILHLLLATFVFIVQAGNCQDF